MQQEHAATNRRLHGEGLEGSKGYPVRLARGIRWIHEGGLDATIMIGRELGIPAIPCATGTFKVRSFVPATSRLIVIAASAWPTISGAPATLYELTLSLPAFAAAAIAPQGCVRPWIRRGLQLSYPPQLASRIA